MSFTPDDRGTELRALFFESANELLQALNEAGLELEARPADEEVIRSVRRAVHTLKGDSAACGFSKLSEVAHELEDILNPQMGQLRGAKFAEVVLVAADSFEAMLSAYQRDAEPPNMDALRAMIYQLRDAPVSSAAVAGSVTVLPAKFDWSEYEHLMISEAIHRGETVFNVALRVDQSSGMRAAAFQLIRNVLHGSGTVIALRPEDNSTAANVDLVEAALATAHTQQQLEQKCEIPSIVSQVLVEIASHAKTAEHELLADLLDAHAAKVNSAIAESAENPGSGKPGALGSAVAAVAESTLRVDAARIDSVMNLVGELIIGKSMLNRALTEFDRVHSKDPVRAKLADALA
ncbi:MAG TPA: Hpt domain-containing protein, partial [Candidatus Acidoferrum sp.]|nr:Hpt domain-containing protein [Candidatus Acidoferrum sp.]